MKKVMVFLFVLIFSINFVLAQRLPEGTYHANRERSIDITHYKAELRFDFKQKKLMGTATVVFHPLIKTKHFALDAINLHVKKVSLKNPHISRLNFSTENSKLEVQLDKNYSPQETLAVQISYDCQPNAGLYFMPDPVTPGQYFIHTYGEGGLHANWLPIYNDVNDKFSSEMVVTVPRPYVVISNGRLIENRDLANDQRLFHWKQSLPHANYLIALYVGEFEKGDLPAAFGKIPMHYWVPKGHLKEGAYAFKNTPRMVEFFSRKFNYTFPWDKYDQVAVPDYAIGAMEHTGVTGLRWSVLRTRQAPYDFGPPDFNRYHNFWTYEGTISHELAHHWFGDNLTCRNLSYIWLNESFASYLQMLWDEEAYGRDQFLITRQVALDRYLDYVHNKHIIRPLEYHYFEKPDDIYNEEHTYLKGALILNMLRYVLGDANFFRALSHYLHKHEFSNVESEDLKIAIEEATGRNLDWFFEDWIYDGGHPIFEVSYKYLPDLKKIDLLVKQVQPIVEGQDLFTLPVDITIATKSGTDHHTIWVEDEEEHYLLPCPQRPLMVSFDGRGALVAEIRFEKKLDELIYQIQHDDLPGRIRALRQLVQRYPNHSATLQVLNSIITGNGFWGWRAEAAQQLGVLRTRNAEPLIENALKDSDYRIRKAAVLALPSFRPQFARRILKKVIQNDTHTDVVATAIVALSKIPNVEKQFIIKQLDRPAWYDEITMACLVAFKNIGDASLVTHIKKYTNEKYNVHVRMAGFEAWKNCSPEDPELHQRLITAAQEPPYSLQQMAIQSLGTLHVAEAKQVLKKLMETVGDQNITVLAKKALSEIDRVYENKNSVKSDREYF